MVQTILSFMIFFTASKESQFSVRNDGIQMSLLNEGFDACIEQCQADRLDEVARLRSQSFGEPREYKLQSADFQ